jgi:hypothetical protein
MRPIASALGAIKSRFPPVQINGGPAGVRLSSRQSRSATTIHGWPSLILGLPFVGVGLAIIAAAAGYITVRQSGGRHVPSWLLASIGAVFAWAGLSFVVHGLRGARRTARSRRLRAAHPGEPWRWDHAWDERASTDDTGARAGQSLYGTVFMAVFLAPFHWIGFVAPDGPLMFGIVALLFDIAVVALICHAVYLLARRLKYGSGRALLARFPFRPGSTLELHVQAPQALPQHAVASATLRCIQERYVRSGSGEDTTVSVECFELYRDVAPAPWASAGAGVRSLRVRFDLPHDIPITDLASRPCRYWEVDIEASTDGVDYAARYLVPVY